MKTQDFDDHRVAIDDPSSRPAYTIAEASRYLQMPDATLRDWCVGHPRGAGSPSRHSQPVIEIADPASRYLSFVNLVEAHVLNALRRQHRISLQQLRSAIEVLHSIDPRPHPLALNAFAASNLKLFVVHYGNLVNLSERGQLEMREVLDTHLKRVEWNERGFALRLYPFVRAVGPTAPRLVVIDPRVGFGRPTLAGSGVPTAAIASRFDAGESIAELSADFELAPEAIQEAIRCELRAA